MAAGFDAPAPSGEAIKESLKGDSSSNEDEVAAAETKKNSSATTIGAVAIDPDLEARLNNCVLVGDFAGAVSVSIAAGRCADALLLAASAPDQPDLWSIAQKAFFKQQGGRRVVKIVQAVMDDELSEYIATTSLSLWREVSVLSFVTPRANDSMMKLHVHGYVLVYACFFPFNPPYHRPACHSLIRNQ